MSDAVAVVGVGVYAPGYPDAARFLSGSPDPEAPAPTGALLDKHSRRRASLLTKAFADAYGQALAESKLEPAQVGSVFGSAIGEAATMISLLDQMWREGGALSPMRFATSVHNAASGVVSIATKNQQFTTSLGADYDTPAMALLEGIALVKAHGMPVIVACGDEAAPGDLVGPDEGWQCLTCAVALVPEQGAEAGLPRLRAPRQAEPTLAPPELPHGLALNPQAGLLDLIDGLRRGQSGVLRLDRGRGRGYAVEIVAGA